MTENLSSMSLAEIQQILKQQQNRIQQLQKRREKILASLQEVDDEIAQISGSENGSGRFKNEQSLEQVICDILAKHKKGLTLNEITEAVGNSGYQSSSHNFKNVVYQNVYKSERITRDEKTKKYVLA